MRNYISLKHVGCDYRSHFLLTTIRNYISLKPENQNNGKALRLDHHPELHLSQTLTRSRCQPASLDHHPELHLSQTLASTIIEADKLDHHPELHLSQTSIRA